MTRQEVKEYLRGVESAIRRERIIIKQIEKLESRLSVTQQLSGMPRGGKAYTVEDYVIERDELIRKLKEARQDQVSRYADILDTITKLECEHRDVYIDLLTSRYLLLRTWEEIAVDLELSYKWVHVLHGRALDEIMKIF